VELLAVVATIGILTALLLPTLANTRQTNQAAQCLENHRRLMAAWRIYAEDNSGILTPNEYPYTAAYWPHRNDGTAYKYKTWAAGTMSQAADARGYLDSYSILTDSAGTALASYIRDRALYHCPADNYVDPYEGRVVHCRSVSMNAAVGTKWHSSVCGFGSTPCGAPVDSGWLPGSTYNPNQTSWLIYGKLSSFTRPGPASTFVLMEENSITINDGLFAVSAIAVPGQSFLIDYPSGNYNGAASISFADGHAVSHQWLDRRSYSPPVNLHGSGGGTPALTSPDDPDCFYLASIASARQ
jgi:prepilin-type processing-associated H-X9-DG protein